MKKIWLNFLCRYYYRYRVYWFIKGFVNNSSWIYKAKSFGKIGDNKYLFVVAVHKRYGTQKASIAIIKPYLEWNLSYSFKKVNTRLWRDIFNLKNPYERVGKERFWRYDLI